MKFKIGLFVAVSIATFCFVMWQLYSYASSLNQPSDLYVILYVLFGLVIIFSFSFYVWGIDEI